MRFLNLRILALFTCLAICASLLASLPDLGTASPSGSGDSAQFSSEEDIWQVNDTIGLRTGWVEWTEHWHNPYPHSWIEEGFWFEYHIREYLIDSDDIFLKLDETFNWTKVNSEFFDPSFNDWQQFNNNVTEDPLWWLDWYWGFDCLRYGISANRTFVDAELEGEKAFVRILCHVSHVSEYLIGWELGVGELGAGNIFDLRSISLGRVENYEYCLDYTGSSRSIQIHFSAPSTILDSKGQVSTATIHLNTGVLQQLESYSLQDRNVMVVMPSDTEIFETSKTPSPKIDKNVALFTISEGEKLPDSFTIKSMPPQKTIFETVLLHPEFLAALITVLVLLPSSIQGLRMFRRHRTFNRLLRLLVKLYREQKSNPEALEREMDNLTETIFTSFIQGNLTDEQLEKLLHRRDDLLGRI